MSTRRTLCALVIAAAPFGSLVAATAAQADPFTPPTVTSVQVNGTDLATNGTGTYYTDDPIDDITSRTSDDVTVTLLGDPSATDLDLSLNGDTAQTQAPDGDGQATFHVTLPAGQTTLSVSQNGGGTDSNTFVNVGNVPTLYLDEGDTKATGDEIEADGIPGTPVKLFVDGDEVASANADEFGTAHLTLPDDVSVDHHTAYAETVDAQGNAGDPSDAVGFYVQPDAPQIDSPDCNPLGQPCYVNHGSSQITVSDVVTGATVKLYEVNGEGDEVGPLDTVTADDSGTVNLTPSTPAADGFHYYVARQSVAEGSADTFMVLSSERSDSVGLAVDTAAPELSSNVFGSTTDNPKPTLFFNVEGFGNGIGADENAKVRLIDATTGLTLGEASLSGGEWTPSTPLADGLHSIYAVSIDDFGHVGTTHSNTVTFTVDTSVQVPDGPQFGDGPEDGGGQPTTPTTPTTPEKPAQPSHIPNQPQFSSTTPSAPKSLKLSSSTLSDSHPVTVAFTVTKSGKVKLTLVTTVNGKTKVIGTVTVKVKAGKVTYKVTTKFGGHKVGAGSYKLQVQSVSGSHTSKAVSVPLKVKAKKKH
jgi:hypothetical protein